MELIYTSLPFTGVMSSEIGGRKENQDTCGYAETERGLLLVVCDGMGGGPAGKTASMIAASTILDYIKIVSKGLMPALEQVLPAEESNSETDGSMESSEEDNVYAVKEASKPESDKAYLNPSSNLSDRDLLEYAVKAANYEMRRRIAEEPTLAGMGTTVTALLINKYAATMAHVGDSRIYQIRNKKIVFRTADHSRVGEMVRNGTITEEQARLSVYSNIITRALGINDEVDVEIDVRPFEKGDRFVLCTDGIWGTHPQPDMVKLFVNNPRSMQGTVDVLNLEVEKVGKEKGGKHDNYSIIILDVNINSILKETMSRKTRYLLYGLGIFCILSIILNIVLLCISNDKDKDREIEQLKEAVAKEQEQVQTIKDELNDKQREEKTADKEQVRKQRENSSEQQPTITTKEVAENSDNNIGHDQESDKNYNKKIDEIISCVKALNDQNIEQRKESIKNIKKEFKEIESLVPAEEHERYKQIEQWLDEKITFADNDDKKKADGHRKKIVKELEQLKKQ